MSEEEKESKAEEVLGEEFEEEAENFCRLLGVGEDKKPICVKFVKQFGLSGDKAEAFNKLVGQLADLLKTSKDEVVKRIVEMPEVSEKLEEKKAES